MTTLLDPALALAAENHHEVLRGRLIQHVQSLIDAVDSRTPDAPARRRLTEFLRSQLLPHLDAEEILLLTTGEAGPATLLVRAMRDEHRVLAALIREIEQATEPMAAAVAAGALVVLYDVRAQQENRHLLPALAATGVDIGILLEDTPEIVGGTVS